MPGDMDPCMVCDGLLNMGKEDRLEARRRAEEEKVCTCTNHGHFQDFTVYAGTAKAYV
jgi:hypothetical protein